MNATLRTLLAAVACLWLLSTVAMAQAAGRAPASGLGGRELILIAAIALLLAGVSRLSGLEEARSIGESHGVHGAPSRAYLDRLLGPARIRLSADELPRTGTEARTGLVVAEKEADDIRRLKAILVLFSAVLLAGCQALGDSTSSKEGKEPGGLLRALRPDPITVPEGATLPLVLETAISSETSRSGDRVVARLAEDVRVGEKVRVPAGSEIRGRVTAAVPSGRVKTRARLAFDFDTLVLQGKEYSIGTGPIDITAGDTHNKDAATIGIGAGAGAIVGAIVDGKKGAGIGALIGGAAGTGVVLTKTGKEVELGTGTRVTVRLTRETRL